MVCSRMDSGVLGQRGTWILNPCGCHCVTRRNWPTELQWEGGQESPELEIPGCAPPAQPQLLCSFPFLSAPFVHFMKLCKLCQTESLFSMSLFLFIFLPAVSVFPPLCLILFNDFLPAAAFSSLPLFFIP